MTRSVPDYFRRLRADRKANGLCTRCGRRPVMLGSTALCLDCLNYQQNYLRAATGSRPYEQGRNGRRPLPRQEEPR